MDTAFVDETISHLFVVQLRVLCVYVFDPKNQAVIRGKRLDSGLL